MIARPKDCRFSESSPWVSELDSNCRYAKCEGNMDDGTIYIVLRYDSTMAEFFKTPVLLYLYNARFG